MKYQLPKNHGLSQTCIDNLVFKDSGNPAVTEAQFAALEAGVGRGESVLVVSPTSTGKTQIALWAIARSIEARTSAVYLVTHRALAKQKFEDFKTLLLTRFLAGNAASLVIATGDYVEDADGEIPADPLHAPLLVATYEKYLALLSGAGVPADMTKTVVVCDEIQLIGDQHRGQNVEVLLSLLKNAGWNQLVGLSAVLEPKDAKELGAWLDVKLVTSEAREKHLRYECWSSAGICTVSTANPTEMEEGSPLPKGVELDPLDILASLLRQKSNRPVPIILFCTRRKQDTYSYAERFIKEYLPAPKGQLSLAFDGMPETSANTFLARAMSHRVAVHSADLLDEERAVVEQHLLEGKLDVIFATTTLAAGVNFPLGAAIFVNWDRYDRDLRSYLPIGADEFHNMAGRVGRVGFDHDHGRVIFITTDERTQDAREYLNLGALPQIEARVSPQRFDQLALQLVASGLCPSRANVERLICSTFSAVREQDRNKTAFDKWPVILSEAIDSLVKNLLLLETSKGILSATPVGQAIAFSGLLPQTGAYLLENVIPNSKVLAKCLPSANVPGDMFKLAFLLFSACYSSPEFRPSNG